MRFSIKKLLISLSIGTAIALSSSASIAKVEEFDPNKRLPTITPENYHSETNRLISHLLTSKHYRAASINDKLSSQIYERFLESIDPGRYYFYESDIANFEQYRDHFDEWLLKGELSPAFGIYNIFRKRFDERIKFALATLEKPFDFSKDEAFNIDREEAPWAKNKDDADALWIRKLKHEALTMKLGGKQSDEKITEGLKKRYINSHRRAEQTTSEDVFQVYMNTFTEVFDPHSSYMSPRTSENFDIHMSLSLEGIGAVLRTEYEYTKIVELVVGGPAEMSKQLKPDDKIIGVAQGDDDEYVDVIGWRIEDVVDLIRGKKGTTVKLQVIPANDATESIIKEVKIVRDKIKLEEKAAKSEVIDIKDGNNTRKIGVIEIPTFYIDFKALNRGEKNYKSTTRDVRKLISELRKNENIDGLVIDLRGNGGGSLQESLQLTGLFIEEGPVVQVRDRRGHVQALNDPDDEIFYTGPLAVIVDRFSASASEIFSGAIQDYGRGIVLGDTTFGKGTVQRMFPFNNYKKLRTLTDQLGNLKITEQMFFRVSGSSTQNRGVVPDIEFPSALDHDDYGERAYDFALPWFQIKQARYERSGNISQFIGELNARHLARVQDDPLYSIYVEEVNSVRKARNETVISLNEEKRKLEIEKLKKEQRNRLNRQRDAQGLEPIAEEDEVPDDYEAPDVILTESANILLDLIKIKSNVSDQMAATK